MESKHFSHNHGLIFHQMPQGSKIHCSGCKSPGLENAYVCWKCNYFLHEQCFRAARSLKHASHPLHPLTLAPFPTYSSGSFSCKYCNLVGKGFSYSCSECEFDIHVHCAHIPNPHYSNPQPQNQIYSSQIQNSAIPTYPPRSPTIPNDVQSYPPRQPQVTSFPPDPNNPLPNSSSPRTTIPNQTQNYGNPQSYQPNHNPIPILPQPNHNFVNSPNPNPPNQDNRIPVFSHLSPPNTSNPNQSQNYTSLTNAYPPNHNNQSHIFPNFSTSNTNTYSPNQMNHVSTFSNFSPPNTNTPNQTQNYTNHVMSTYPSNQNNHIPSFPDPTPNFSKSSTTHSPPMPPPQPYAAATNPPPMPPPQPFAAATNPPPMPPPQPYDATNPPPMPPPQPYAAATNPPPMPPPQPYAAATNPPPPLIQPTPIQFPQTNHHQPKSPTMIHHFSHPHAMKAIEIEQNDPKTCSACNCKISGGSAYSCFEPHCNFNLHTSCFDSPLQIRHNSHLQHHLTLHPTPPYDGGFTCDACQKQGNAFVYNCADCSFDLHINCVKWPETMTRPDHKHNLTLNYSSPIVDSNQYATFTCDVCMNAVHRMGWMYYCRECDFGTHLECVGSEVKKVAAKTEAELLRMQEELRLHALEMKINNESRKAILKLWDDSDSD